MKLIPKKQTAWGKLEYNGPTYMDVQEKMKKENPEAYNRLLVEVARSRLPNSEMVRYTDANGNMKTASTNIGMSGADPIGLLYVEGVALNPIFKGLGRVALYGLAKAGNNWARAKILSREIDKSNMVANSLLPKPKIRTKVGDIEIDNPLLYYRQGSKEMADDFLESGIVSTDGAFANPMFAQGHLWYGIPKRMTKRENTEIVTKRGFKFNFGKRNEDVPKTHLLVSNPSTNMIGSNHHARPANTLVYKLRNGPINDADIPRYNQDLGKDFVSRYLDAYYNGELEDGMATIVTHPGGSRRIPATYGEANKSNTLLYEYDPNYGYRLVPTSPEKTSLKFFERPSKLSKSERLGVPKGERNQPIKLNIYRAGTELPENSYSLINYPGEYDPITNPTGTRSSRLLWNDLNTKAKGDLRITLMLEKAQDSDKIISLLKRYASQYEGELEPFVINHGDLFYTPEIIGDYRTYLNHLGYDGAQLTDLEIAKIISSLYRDLSSRMSGKGKGKVLWHSSPNWFDLFNYHKYLGVNTGNTGFAGAGNNFSTNRTLYGSNNGKVINIQPYMINNVKSIPGSTLGRERGFVSNYGYTNLADAVNQTAKDYKLIWNTSGFNPPGTLRSGPTEEFTWRRNDNIKSLFPHPSTIVENNDGTISIIRDWNNPMVNYKQGGKLKQKLPTL